MRKYGLQHHRARSRPPTSRPKALTATGPNQVYSWDIVTDTTIPVDYCLRFPGLAVQARSGDSLAVVPIGDLDEILLHLRPRAAASVTRLPRRVLTAS